MREKEERGWLKDTGHPRGGTGDLAAGRPRRTAVVATIFATVTTVFATVALVFAAIPAVLAPVAAAAIVTRIPAVFAAVTTVFTPVAAIFTPVATVFATIPRAPVLAGVAPGGDCGVVRTLRGGGGALRSHREKASSQQRQGQPSVSHL